MNKKLNVILSFGFFFMLQLSFAQNAGDLFTAFGTNGTVATNIGQADFIVKSQAVQSDGKLLLFGNVEGSYFSNTYLLRLNTDGTLDTSFNTDGKIIINDIEFATKVLVQSDSKIVIGGSLNFDVVLMRYNTNGTLDTTFGTDGIVSNDSDTTSRSMQDFTIQTDGKFLVLSDFYSGSQDYRVLRYNANGIPDTAFGNNGSITTDIGDTEFAKTIAIHSDGKFIVGGTTVSDAPSTFSIFVARYNSSGTLDASFNSNGKKVVATSVFNDFLNVALQEDGKILFGYTSYVSSSPKLKLIRLNTNGNYDTTYGTSGVATFTAPTNFGNGSKKFKIQADGKVFVFVNSSTIVNNASNNNLLMMRINTNATLDTSFNGSGFQEFSFFTNNDTGSDFSLVDNQIIVSGNTEETLVLNKIGVAKFNSSGSLDLSFGTDGKSLYYFPYEGYDESKCSTIQADGKIIVAGTSHVNQNSILSVVRYHADGSIDTSFGTNGIFKLNTQIYDAVNSVKVDGNGRILLATDLNATVIRLNSNGTLDGSFGVSGFATITTAFSSTADIKVLADNSILVAGRVVSTVNNVSSFNFMLAKLDANGILVPTFGSNGITTINATPNYDELLLVDTQADGKIVTVGTFVNANNDSQIVIFRTNANGVLDTTFNTSGIFVIGIPSSADIPKGLQIQADGKILMANTYNDGSNTLLFRVNTDGTLDTSFDTDGVIYFDTNLINTIEALKILDNQQIVAVGASGNASTNFTVLKLNSNGALDTTFGTNGVVNSDFNDDYAFASGIVLSNDNNIIVSGTTFSETSYGDFAVAKYYLNTNLGIGENTFNKTVLFYPNPVQNVLQISNDVTAVTLFTLDGKQINTTIVNNSIVTENLPKGVYIIQMKLVSGEVISNKLIKE
ncbi:T9SS type A sorting domain-containing protein [Flavobacterium sp. SM2513]|uniref:T9SS type A sorting domain-containing protein n=1 Tax=Flavobacterium sp. SM2513 TaxID=3424766 RepID=UPI003D7F4D3A